MKQHEIHTERERLRKDVEPYIPCLKAGGLRLLITDVTQWVPATGQPGGFGRVNEFTRWKALRAEGRGGLRGQDRTWQDRTWQDRTWQDRTWQDRTARPCCPDAALFDCPARSAFQRVNSFTRPNPPGTRPGSPGPAPQPPRNLSRRVTSVSSACPGLREAPITRRRKRHCTHDTKLPASRSLCSSSASPGATSPRKVPP